MTVSEEFYDTLHNRLKPVGESMIEVLEWVKTSADDDQDVAFIAGVLTVVADGLTLAIQFAQEELE